VATSNMTIGDLKGFLELSKSMAGGLTITDFGALFDRIEQLLKSFNQWTPELESSLALAEKELSANPGLFDIGKAEFVSSVDKLLAKYPANTLLKDIPEFSGSGGDGSGDLPPITSIGDFDIAKIAAIHAEVKMGSSPSISMASQARRCASIRPRSIASRRRLASGFGFGTRTTRPLISLAWQRAS
jgi:hypothetical protein